MRGLWHRGRLRCGRIGVGAEAAECPVGIGHGRTIVKTCDLGGEAELTAGVEGAGECAVGLLDRAGQHANGGKVARYEVELDVFRVMGMMRQSLRAMKCQLPLSLLTTL